jgi:methionine aminopeptidase
MTITHDDDLDHLQTIGRIVTTTMHRMAAAMKPGMTTAERDALGADLLAQDGAIPAQVRHGKPMAGNGIAIGGFAAKRGYTLIRNLASHGIGRRLHEEPDEIPTWPTSEDRRRIHDGMVLTVEPFLSRGGHWADTGDKDDGTLYSTPKAPVMQYEHTVVATRKGPIIVTLPG